MRLFHPDSELVRLNANGRLRAPDPQLVTLLGIARQISARSAGAFDVSMQPLWSLWSKASSQGETPSPRSLQREVQLVNWGATQIDRTEVSLDRRGMSLSLNGIAQGWAADRVRSVLASRGIRHAMVDCGETALLGNAPEGGAWGFAIEDAVQPVMPAVALPRLFLPDGRAIATSSDRHTSFSPDRRHHHILDPRTGYSPGVWSSVTVLAPTCVVADALTKAFFMLPASRVLTAARKWGVDVVLQDKSGQWMASRGAGFTPPVSDQV
jgi:thiamine biosynthesis lipoprotein